MVQEVTYFYSGWLYFAFGLKYELITNLMQLNVYLCTFSSTCFGLVRPSSGAMDVIISYICSIWCPWCSKVSVLRSVCAGGVLHCSATLHQPETCRAESTQ